MSQGTLQEDQWIAIHDHNDNESLRLGQDWVSEDRSGTGTAVSQSHMRWGWDKGLTLNIDPKQRIQKSPVTGPTTPPHSSQIIGYTAEKNQN